MIRKTAVITGASGGIGLSTARLFADNGFVVYSLSRTAPQDNRIKHIPSDISLEDSVRAAITEIIKKEGKIDVLVNNAGIGISGSVELTDPNEARRLFDINLFGAFFCIKHVLPHMRTAGSGHIINISSVAAVLPLPYQSFYSCSKSALNALTLSLANEVKHFGIKVCAVMPGDVRTGFTEARKKSEAEKNAYSIREQKSVLKMEKDELNGMPPEKTAKCIYKAALKKRPRPLYTVGASYRLFVFLAKLLPARLVNRIEGIMYG